MTSRVFRGSRMSFRRNGLSHVAIVSVIATAFSIAPADWIVAIVTPRRRFASVRGETARWQRFARSKVWSREKAFSCASCWVLQKSFRLGENHKTGGV